MKFAVLALLATSCLPLAGCQIFFHGDDVADDVPDAQLPSPDADPLEPDAMPRPDATPIIDGGVCNPQVRNYSIEPAPHVADGTTVTYSSNPPSSGPHYSQWARWNQTYAAPPMKRENWVHNMEHGGVVLLYNCPQAGGCPDVVANLEALEQSLDADPLCNGIAGVRTRTLISADPLLPEGVQVAAASWGFTYTAACFDEDSLRSFYLDHFGHASESLCAQGSVP